MKLSHPQALAVFSRRLERLLVLRSALQLATVWFFVWGVAVLALKMGGVRSVAWLTPGLLGCLPLVVYAAAREHRRRPAAGALRANYDRLNLCGGLVMAGEVADMTDWQARLPGASVPALRWHGGRTMGLLGLSLVFAATAWWLPARYTTLGARHTLEIGALVDQLQGEVQLLQQEKIVKDQKAEDFHKQLSQLKEDSSAVDPDKTWEALDHIKESDTAAAKQAAEEALAKTTSLAQAETMAQAMKDAAGTGMTETTASQAAQNLAAMLKAAKLEDGLFSSELPPELLANLSSLSPEDLDKLMKALAANKESLASKVGKLADHKLIDPSLLAQCKAAGQCTNSAALAEYLSSCTNGQACSLAECMRLGKGGPGGGGPPAPMTWSDGTSEKDLKFKEHVLPPATQLEDAKLVGVSRAAPQLSANDPDAAQGALDNAAGAGGSAQAQVILPEHRQAVREFFKRDP
jgi:hypothetical protein